MNGKVARLDSLENNIEDKVSKDSIGRNHNDKRELEEVSLCEQKRKKQKIDDTEDGTVKSCSDKTKLLENVQQKLTELVGEKAAEGTVTMLSKWESFLPTKESPLPIKGVEDESKLYTLPLITDKQKRKEIHMLVRSELLKPFALADTHEQRVRIWHKNFERQMPNFGKFDNRGENNKSTNKNAKSKKEKWPKDRPDFLQFVLYKENIDTGTAAKDLARIARLPPKGHGGPGGAGVSYAGMKDKRGVTAQFCTVYRRTPRDILVANGQRSNRNGGGGNTTYQGSAIMRVGNFSYVHKAIRLGMLSGNRFDIALRNISVDANDDMSEIKKKLEYPSLLFKKNGFINYFGMQRFGKFHDTHEVGIAVLKGDFKQACEKIMRVKSNEHERQVAARKIWASRFDNIDTNDEKLMKEAESKCARTVLKSLGRFMNCEVSIISSLIKKPCDYKNAFRSIAKHMRSMFLHSYQSLLWNKAVSHRISHGGSQNVITGDLVMVEEKNGAEGGSGTSGLKGKAVKVVTEDDIKKKLFKITDVVLPLVGSKVVLPENDTGAFFASMLKEEELNIKHLSHIDDKELALCGDYRRIICKPLDVDFQVKLYKEPLQPLLKTDLMQLNRIELDCDDVNDLAEKESKALDVEKSVIEVKEKALKSEASSLVGAVIGFTLPPSAYATIALREFMRRPTSSEYQSGLMLEGNCERNVSQ
mmetsp:Transcript_6748/g.9727  ORF Transcript_6748/g.9727 Transcript_6748/m.9727 type:complete len:701 (-) Transcript_6748:124-2226(-)|eukprot:CAMPEP_0184858332 /NCGR_PEP_ID=MMETSP0580-20130426/3453_1 /TAXON_ID=1118495 /ORGANISM="Dactyliosolen fragilissimus" /LENGTH=700 /DNA_ID=CAMNT_0027354433 /DNA_START=214 /DNA_END=2316 /DNA_ORIENTATION=+